MAARTTVLVPSTVHPDTGMRVARRLQSGLREDCCDAIRGLIKPSGAESASAVLR